METAGTGEVFACGVLPPGPLALISGHYVRRLIHYQLFVESEQFEHALVAAINHAGMFCGATHGFETRCCDIHYAIIVISYM